MARILYCISKEGMGHAVRSKVLAKELSKKHEVMIITGGKQFDYLSNYFNKIKKIDDFDLVYRDNSISFISTFIRNFFRLPLIAHSFFKVSKHIRKFKPDVIISDFEPLSNLLSYLLKKPLISVDNQHVITKCEIDVPRKFWIDFMISSAVISSIITNARYYFVTSYFFPRIKRKNAFLFPPIVREEVIKTKIKNKHHILVYQTSESYKELINILKKTDFSFIFYGNREGKEGNIIFKKFGENEYIKDLASCKAVITNGGFGLISEAIYLKKPILSIPVKKQFEQILNAIHLKKLGYGGYYFKINDKKIEKFINDLPKFRKNFKEFKRDDNSKILNKVEDVISELIK